MATIILKPGESFEHLHLEKSSTTHVEGKIELSFDGQTMLLNEGQTVIIPSKTSHMVKNVGNNNATFDCSNHVVIVQA